MISLNILIVEDDREARLLYKSSIAYFNSSQSEIEFLILAEVETYDDAVGIIMHPKNDIALILLDIELKSIKSGYDLLRDYPDLPYAIVTKDKIALEYAINHFNLPQIYFFRNKRGGAADFDDIVNGLEDFVRKKNASGGFYLKHLEVNGKKIYWNDVAIISKRPWCVDEHKNLVECMICYKPIKDKDKIFGCTNRVNTNIENHVTITGKKNSCLFKESFTEYAIKTIIQEANINPNQFVMISTSIAINLNYVRYFDTKNFKYYIEINDNPNYTAPIQGSDELEPHEIDRILVKLDKMRNK